MDESLAIVADRDANGNQDCNRCHHDMDIFDDFDACDEVVAAWAIAFACFISPIVGFFFSLLSSMTMVDVGGVAVGDASAISYR